MTDHRVAGSPFDLVQGALEFVVGERLHLAAVVADEVMVVLATCVDRLKARGAGADVDPLHEAVPRQLLECAVDARGADATTPVAQLVEDLLRRQAAMLTSKQLDYRSPRTPVAMSARVQRGDRRRSPRTVVGPLGHSSKMIAPLV